VKKYCTLEQKKEYIEQKRAFSEQIKVDFMKSREINIKFTESNEEKTLIERLQECNAL